MDSKVVTRELKKHVWPMLREHGFDVSTSRAAWRYQPNRIEVIEFISLGHYLAEKCGCTSFSFQVELGSALPAYADYQARSPRKEWPRPRTVDADFRFFVPCIRYGDPTIESVWYVDPDGGNLSQQLDDLVTQLNGMAWDWFNRWADDNWVFQMLQSSDQVGDNTIWPHPGAIGPRGVLLGTLKHRMDIR